LALPQRTRVPMKARLQQVAMSPLEDACWPVDLELGDVSPVRLDSSTHRSQAWGGSGSLCVCVYSVCVLCVCVCVYLHQPQVSWDSVPH